MSTLKIGIVQQQCTPELDNNLLQSLDGIEQAASEGARLIILQELHRSLYFCQQEDTSMFDLAEPIPGPSCEIFSKAAAKHNVVIVTSLFEKRAPGIYHNTAVVFDTDGSIAGKYRKMHIPDDPGFYEKFYFTPGDLGFTPIKTSIGTLGVLVCWDQWFPEAARLMATAGAELLIYPTAIGWDPSDDKKEQARQRDAWITIQCSHGIANGIPIISVNRVGHEPDPAGGNGIQFWGSSFVAGPQGEILFEADTQQECIATINIDMEKSEQVRRIWPYLRDRRIDGYEDLVKRYRD